MKYVDTWDLDAIFPGGTKSPQLQDKLKQVEGNIEELKQQITSWNFTENKSAQPLKVILAQQETIEKIVSRGNVIKIRIKMHIWMISMLMLYVDKLRNLKRNYRNFPLHLTRN